jgi:DNA-binding response OmpR family regulator
MTDKPKILIVEKDIPAAMMLVHTLTRAGCDVRVAPSARQGLDLARATQFNLVVLDLDLPDLKSLDLDEKFKQRLVLDHTPIVCISAQPCDEKRQHGLELGAVDYIEKSLRAEDWVPQLLSHIKAATNPIAVAESMAT